MSFASGWDLGITLTGGKSCFDNLSLIRDRKKVFSGRLRLSDKDVLLEGLGGIVSDCLLEKIWEMIWSRYRIYENL